MKPLKHLHFPSRAYYNNNMYIYVFLRTTARGAREVLLSVIFFFFYDQRNRKLRRRETAARVPRP